MLLNLTLFLTLFLFRPEGELIGNIGEKIGRATYVRTSGHKYLVIFGYIDYGACVKRQVVLTSGLLGSFVENFHPEG